MIKSECHDDLVEIQSESKKFYSMVQSRYGLAIVEGSYGKQNEFIATLAAGLRRAGVTPSEVAGAREWLITGLRPFSQFPPSIESLIQIGRMVGVYGYSTYAISMSRAWYVLDSGYIARYGRLWRTDGHLDDLLRERVWVAQFEELGVTAEDVGRAEKLIRNSESFRRFPPKIDQFSDAIQVARVGATYLVEDAWLHALAISAEKLTDPLVKAALGKVGGFEIRSGSNTRDYEAIFKGAYRKIINDPQAIDRATSLAVAKINTPVAEPATMEQVLKALSRPPKG